MSRIRMMDRRKAVARVLAALGLIGLSFATVPFVASLSPSVAARERATLEIPFREFSKRGVYRRYWAPYLILAVREPATKVFYVPAYRGVLYLPDPTWDRALVPCASLQFDDEYFYCDDGRLSDEWRSHARWDRTGKTESPWMPPLMQARFTEKRDALVITREDL